MAKIYTAQEMREMAKDIEAYVVMGPIDVFDSTLNRAIDMLRQAADLIEREVKREKKYEYATILSNVTPSNIHDDMCERGYHHFRREVGEWEEVKNG